MEPAGPPGSSKHLSRLCHMSPTVFCKKTADTPTGRFGAGTGTVTLPPELLREASRRLGWAGLIYAFGYFLAYWAPYLLSGAHPLAGADCRAHRCDDFDRRRDRHFCGGAPHEAAARSRAESRTGLRRMRLVRHLDGGVLARLSANRFDQRLYRGALGVRVALDRAARRAQHATADPADVAPDRLDRSDGARSRRAHPRRAAAGVGVGRSRCTSSSRRI